MRVLPENIRDLLKEPIGRLVDEKQLLKILDEEEFFLFVHVFPILGKWLKVFGSQRFLRAMLRFDTDLCKTFLRNFCWVYIFLLEKSDAPRQ